MTGMMQKHISNNGVQKCADLLMGQLTEIMRGIEDEEIMRRL